MADLRDGNIANVKRDEFRRLLGPKPLTEHLLNWLGTITLSATAETFVVRDRINEIKKSGRQIYTGSNFEKWFFDKTIELIGEKQLRYGKLLRDEVDRLIIAELGGEAKAETTLAEIFGLMEMQKNDEKGVLLNNGYANIFYVRDIVGVLRAVLAFWYGDSWLLDADSVELSSGWHEGYLVLSRNS